jgi:hypothetical protein
MIVDSHSNRPKYSSSSSTIRGTIDGVIVAIALVPVVAWVNKFCRQLGFEGSNQANFPFNFANLFDHPTHLIPFAPKPLILLSAPSPMIVD